MSEAKMSFKQLTDEAVATMAKGRVRDASALICAALLHPDASTKKGEMQLRRLEVAASLADNLIP